MTLIGLCRYSYVFVSYSYHRRQHCLLHTLLCLNHWQLSHPTASSIVCYSCCWCMNHLARYRYKYVFVMNKLCHMKGLSLSKPLRYHHGQSSHPTASYSYDKHLPHSFGCRMSLKVYRYYKYVFAMNSWLYTQRCLKHRLLRWHRVPMNHPMANYSLLVG